MPDLYLPASPRPKPGEQISSIDLERREAQKERTAMHMAELLEREKMRRRDLVRWFMGEAE